VLIDEKTIKEKGEALEKNLIIVKKDDKISVLPKVKEICPKCNHNEAETWQQQMRSADEPSTHFFRCLKCKFTWREY
jgi:DNA-directed RNA polymerase subunit M